MDARRTLIESAFAGEISHQEAADAVRSVMHDLDTGVLRVATPAEDGWTVHAWVKQAILLFFRIAEMRVMVAGPF